MVAEDVLSCALYLYNTNYVLGKILTQEFFCDNLTKKMSQKFLIKIVIQNSCAKFDLFSRGNGLFVFLQKEAKVLNNQKNCSKRNYLIFNSPVKFYVTKFYNFFLQKVKKII